MRRGTEEENWKYCSKDSDIVIQQGTPDETRKYSTRDEERDAIIQEIEDGETYWQIRKRHKGFVFWNRRQVLDYMYDEERSKAGSTGTLPAIKTDESTLLL